MTRPFAYYVEGIGEDFLPSTIDLSVLDDIVRVDDKECFMMTRRLAREEGLFVGGSAGAAVAGAIKYAERTQKQQNILVLIPDGGAKYLSKIYNDDWMRQNGFLDEDDPLGTVHDLMAFQRDRELVRSKKGDTIRQVIGRLKEHGISQVPVLDGEKMLGLVAEVDLLNHLARDGGKLDDLIDGLIESDYASVSPATKVALLRNVFNDAKAVVIEDHARLVGIVTKIDLIEYLASRSAA
jgi:cystathionine beta-synthase